MLCNFCSTIIYSFTLELLFIIIFSFIEYYITSEAKFLNIWIVGFELSGLSEVYINAPFGSLYRFSSFFCIFSIKFLCESCNIKPEENGTL